MKMLSRDMVKVKYLLCLGKQEIIDNSGNLTGSYTIAYENPVEIKAHFLASAEKYKEPFGTNFDYDIVMRIEDTESPITENTIIKDKNDKSYEVVKKAEFPNHLVFALKSLDKG